MRILLLKTWLTNIGNGFIDMGAKTCLRKAFPTAKIIEASGFSNYVVDELKFWSSPINIIKRKIKSHISSDTYDMSSNSKKTNVINVGELVDVDVAVIAGCILYEHALRKYEKTLMLLRKRGVPLILLGVGGGDYTLETQKYISNFINKIKPFALITRDSTAYILYHKKFPFSYDGIDCAFYINDWYKPPSANETFVVATFDKIKEPQIHTDKKIIHLTHSPFGNLSKTWIYSLYMIKNRLPRKININTPNLFFSDDIKDYLFFYANAEETHSDRVHACVAALAYGNKAKLYYKTPRANLFSKVLDEDISKKLVTLDKDKIYNKKASQISALKEAIESAI